MCYNQHHRTQRISCYCNKNPARWYEKIYTKCIKNAAKEQFENIQIRKGPDG